MINTSLAVVAIVQLTVIKGIGTPSCVDQTSSRTLDRVYCNTWLCSIDYTFSCVRRERQSMLRHLRSDSDFQAVIVKTRPTFQKNLLWYPHLLVLRVDLH